MTYEELKAEDFEEIEADEFKQGGSRGSNSWDGEGIMELAKNLSETGKGKFLKIDIDKFYRTYRSDGDSEDVIKYASYYSRKELIEAFKKLGTKVEVKTMGTSNNSTEGIMKVHIL